jgi:hypothetical protein
MIDDAIEASPIDLRSANIVSLVDVAFLSSKAKLQRVVSISRETDLC